MRALNGNLKFLCLYLWCLSVGCASWSSNIRRSLTTIGQAETQAIKAFQAYEQEKQEEFRNKASNAQSMDELERVDTEFSSWRKQRDEVAAAFNVLLSSIKTAEATLPLVEQGLKKPADVDSWIQHSLKALETIRELLSHLGIVVSRLDTTKDVRL